MQRHTSILYMKALFAVTIWGASFIATKIALRELTPIGVVWIRFSMGVIILGIATTVRKQFLLPAFREWGYFGILGFLGITFHQWLQSNGLQTSDASTTAWIVSTTPVFMALLGWLILKEGLSWVKILGIFLAFTGVLLVVSKGDIVSISIDKIGAPGDILVLVSAVNWAVFSVFSRRGLKIYPASLMMFLVMITGWLFTSVLFFIESNGMGIIHLTMNGWIAVSFLGIFCSGLAYIAWYDVLQTLTAAQTGAFLYIEPLVAVVVAFFILGEQFSILSLFGGAIILTGVWLVNR